MSIADNLLTQDPFTKILVEQWAKAKDQVDIIDEKMNVESFGKTKLLNARYADANPGLEDLRKSKPTNELANSLRGVLTASELTDDEFVGLYETVRRMLPEFDARLDAYVKANVPEVDDTNKPKEEELVAWREERKTHVDNMNGIRTLLEGTNPEWFKAEGDKLIPKEENKRGAVGGREKTGTRLGGTFRFTFDPGGENETILTDPKLSALPAYAPLKKAGIKTVGDVWKAIEAANPEFDRKSPPDKFSFVLGGFNILATKITDESSEEDDDSTEDIDELTLDVEDDDPEDFVADPDEPSLELFDDDEE